jgi:site-specific DNA recombinase
MVGTSVLWIEIMKRDITQNHQRKRCAIYTRKSSEEGLDKEFNSLDAQREAGKNKILSQRHEGWELINEHYDDGGISGGTMERPALQRMIDDIKSGKIDIVLVYKIDRLSRSMLDFLGMIKFFDEYNVSFVSVTQDLNTDTAMGRLVLNVLQSFAQFEREIASERIKDKIALSKQRGMWMGGAIPLGYDANEGKLIVNESEVEIIKFIFDSFIRTSSATQVTRMTKAMGYKSKARRSKRGNYYPARDFTKSSLYQILNNKLYLGKIEHKEKGEVYDGQHDAIISTETFNQVQAILNTNVKYRQRKSKNDRPYLLKGLLKDPKGYSLTPTYSKKKDKIYRYYVSTHAIKTSYDNCPLKTINAQFLEDIILDQAKRALTNVEWVQRMQSRNDNAVTLPDIRKSLKNFDMMWAELFPAEQARIIQLVIDHIVVHPDKIIITFHPSGMLSVLHQFMPDLKIHGNIDDQMVMEIPVRFQRKTKRKNITTPDGRNCFDMSNDNIDDALIKAIGRAHHWQEMLDKREVKSIQEIAEQENLSGTYTQKIIRLTDLAPDITSAILDGKQPQSLQINTLIKGKPLPLDWNEQRKYLGFL